MVLRKDQENANNGMQEDSVREEIVAVSGTTKISVQNRHQNPLLPQNHRIKRMVEAYREERVSVAEAHLGSLLDNRAEMTSKASARDHLVIIGISPNLNSVNLNRGVGSFAHRQG